MQQHQHQHQSHHQQQMQYQPQHGTTQKTTNNNSLFIGDLSKFCTEVDIENLFSAFGPLLEVKVKRNSNTGKTLSYGFVTFVHEVHAQDAMGQLDGSMFCGRKLRYGTVLITIIPILY